MKNRRQFLKASLATTIAAIFCRAATAAESLSDRINESIASAVRYLMDRQSSDGAWRSEIYGPFKDGPSLTSLIAATFVSLESKFDIESASFMAAKYLAAQIDNSLDNLTYPAYTAAGAVIALNQRPEFASQQKAWLNYLRTLQLTEDLGWQPANLAYGGWGYAATGLQPLNGAPATPLAVPNLSATVFALKALRAAGVCPCDPAIQRAQVFITRCQNWSDESDSRNEIFDDGGFHFLLEDPQRNKAGELGLDRFGRRRFASYGSATADGFRALAYCGLGKKHPRRLAAERWLVRNFSAEEHPGDFQPDREHLRPTLYYYYAASLAQSLQLSDHLRSRAAELASALLSRQRSDGSWANSAVDVREDDPLVATPLAIQALDGCLNS
jgi:squalene-hopene/tetraprenyl-beta-curcumene cyclase